MGKTFKPLEVKLIVGLISNDASLFEKASGILSHRFGKIDMISPLLDFNHSDYYEKEMGKNLKRLFLSFERLIPAARLPKIKLYTNALEMELHGPRTSSDIPPKPRYFAFLHRLKSMACCEGGAQLAATACLRTINIDPGYVSLSKLILATTKSYVHRIYVSSGIFEEITLIFKDRSFQPGALTYPDYRSEKHLEIFNAVREKYRQQIEKKYGPSQLYRCV